MANSYTHTLKVDLADTEYIFNDQSSNQNGLLYSTMNERFCLGADQEERAMKWSDVIMDTKQHYTCHPYDALIGEPALDTNLSLSLLIEEYLMLE